MAYVTTMRVSSHMEIYGLIHTIGVLSEVEINSWNHFFSVQDINEKIMSMDFRNCLTEIETADAQLSHKDGVLIVVTGSLTSDEGVFRRFTQSFFLAPQESGGYFVLTDVFRFISERKPAEINQVATQENEISQNVRPASETCSALPEPIPADGSVISDHVTADSNVTEKQISDLSANGTAIESNDNTQPPVQVPKEDPKKALLVAPPPPTQMDVTKKSYASIVSHLTFCLIYCFTKLSALLAHMPHDYVLSLL
jgi:hypothetical protein